MARLRILQAPFDQTAFGYSETADYVVVWEEETDEVDLEAIWTRFQFVDPHSGPWPPESYRARSLSVGDVVEIDGERWSPANVGWLRLSEMQP